MHTWHWISSAVSLICMVLFSITGITLNHAEFFESEPSETTIEAIVPAGILTQLPVVSEQTPVDALPTVLIDWIDQAVAHKLPIKKLTPEWNEYEIYIQQPLPGGDQWMSIDLSSGDLVYMHSDRGLVSWLNDLHKGRNTSLVWIWFIDIFAVATLIFCITGLLLLQIHAKRRPSTWYITAAGVVVPGLIAWLYI